MLTVAVGPHRPGDNLKVAIRHGCGEVDGQRQRLTQQLLVAEHTIEQRRAGGAAEGPDHIGVGRAGGTLPAPAIGRCQGNGLVEGVNGGIFVSHGGLVRR